MAMQTQYIALAWFLILVTVGVIVVLSIAIVVKRRVARRKSRIDRSVYIPCGYGLSKVWKEIVEKRLNGTVRVRTEPRVFGKHYEQNFNLYLNSNNVTYMFRAKAVDEFLKLKESILTLSPDLEAPPIRGIHAFLMTAREHAMCPPAPRERIEEYCKLYLWARCGLDPFGEAEYLKLCEVQNHLMEYVSRAAAIHDSASPSTPKASYTRRNSAKLLSSSIKLPHSPKGPPTKSSSDNSRILSGVSVRTGTPRSERAKDTTRSNVTNISLKRLTQTHSKGHTRLVSDLEPGQTNTLVTYGKDPDALNRLEDTTLISGDDVLVPAGGSRRGSCGSVGSRTALIDMDPVVYIAQKSIGQTSKHPRSSGVLESLDDRKVMPTSVSATSGDSKISAAGVKNDDVNC